MTCGPVETRDSTSSATASSRGRPSYTAPKNGSDLRSYPAARSGAAAHRVAPLRLPAAPRARQRVLGQEPAEYRFGASTLAAVPALCADAAARRARTRLAVDAVAAGARLARGADLFLGLLRSVGARIAVRFRTGGRVTVPEDLRAPLDLRDLRLCPGQVDDMGAVPAARSRLLRAWYCRRAARAAAIRARNVRLVSVSRAAQVPEFRVRSRPQP